MRIVKRTAFGFAALLALVAGGVIALVIVVGGAGQSAIEKWVGTQLKEVVGAYLKPELQFDSLDYQSPMTVVLTNVRLSAEDPDNKGQRVDIIDAKRIRVELAELPRQGQPLRITAIEMDGATVRLVDAKQGGLVGFSDLLLEQTPDDAPPLSEVLQTKQIVLRNGAIEYDARTPGTEPMRFDQIDTIVNINENKAGTYALDLDLKRQAVLDMQLQADADLDSMRLAVSSLTTSLDMSRQQDRYLPPQVQAFIKEHDLTGKLTLTADGELDLNDLLNSTSKLTLTLTDGHGKLGQYRLPIKTLTLDAQMAERQVVIDRLVGEVLNGEVSGTGGFALDDAMPGEFKLSGNNLRLDELMIADGPDQDPPIDGKADLQINAKAPLMQVLEQTTGSGELRVREGRIARLPLISDLIQFMQSGGNLSRPDNGEAPAGSDKVDLVFEMRGDHAYFSKANVDGTWFAMRGRGKVFFDQRLAMNINAGPLEKVQNAIGLIGRPLGAVTDALLTYRVTGTLSDKTITPVPLGGIIGAPGENE